MARRTSPPFRADHVGSLLRPPALLAAREHFAAGPITAGELAQAEDDAITGAVRMQEETGLQSATDGEFRRAEWHTDFIKRLGGIREAQAANTVPAFGTGQAITYQAHGMEVTGKVHLAEPIFADHFRFFFLEYDDDRSGTFEPLRFVPPGKIVVLGLVTTKTPALESADDLKRRVEQAARYVDADRLCLSPQCGFASTVEGNALTQDQQRAKLDLVVQTAADLWGS